MVRGKRANVILCGEDWGNFDHYVQECGKTIEWTENLPGEKYQRFYRLIEGEDDRKIANAIGKIEEEIQKVLEREKREIISNHKY